LDRRLFKCLLVGLWVMSCHLLNPKEPTPNTVWRKESPTIPGRILALGGTSEHLFACGENGLLLRSSDDGKTWSYLSSNTKNNLFSIWQSMSGALFVVGEGGLLLRSNDQGVYWQSIQTNLQEDLYDVHGIQRAPEAAPSNRKNLPEKLFVVGADGTILTSNDGTKWSQLYSGSQWNLHAIWEDEQQLYVAGVLGTLLLSTDHGDNWELAETGTQHTLKSVYGNSAGEMMLGGERISLENAGSGFLTFANEGGIVWGDSGEIFVSLSERLISREVGQSGSEHKWVERWSSQQEEIEGLWGREDEVFFWTSSGGFYRYSEEKVTLQSMQINEDLYGVFMTHDNGVFVIGEYGSILYQQGGRWERQILADHPSQKLYDFREEPGGLRFIVGEQGILSSAFGDPTWRSEYEAPEPLYGIFGDPSVGTFAVGSYGFIVHTTDAGLHWSEIPIDATLRADLFSGIVTRTGEIYIVGADAMLLRSQDTGKTFERLWLPRVEGFDVKDLFSIEADPDGTLWICGWGNTYFRDAAHKRKTRPDAIVWKLPKGDVNQATITTLETWSMARALWRAPDQRLYAVTKRSLVSTKDGTQWQLELEDGSGLTAIGGDKSKFYVVGLGGNIWSR
jgi:photosystem II stability/assembly factor-like uncharacterized protein